MTKTVVSKGINDEYRHKFLDMQDRLGGEWLKVFSHLHTRDVDVKIFWDAAYWDLLKGLWRENKPVKKTVAQGFIVGKTAPTAAKYINNAIEYDLVIEEKNLNDPRSLLISLSSDMKELLNNYFDDALKIVGVTIDEIRGVTS